MTSTNAAHNRQLLKRLHAEMLNGKPMSVADRISVLRDLSTKGGIDSMEHLLPLFLRLDGEPYTIRNYQPFAPLFRLMMPASLIIKSGRQLSKTGRISTTSKVLLANGQRKLGQELQIGDKVQAIDGNYLPTTVTVVDTMRAKSKPVVKILTRMGTLLEPALTHPFLKADGWAVAGDLKVGDRIATVRQGGVFGNLSVSRDRIIATAYLIGDGGLTDGIILTKTCPQVLEEFSQVIRNTENREPILRTRENTDTKFIKASVAKGTPIKTWMDDDNLRGKKGPQKFLPSWVFELSREDTILFVSRLWGADGCIALDERTGSPQITYSTTARELAYDVKSLLLKFGLPTTIKQREAGYKKDDVCHRCNDAYVVRVETRAGWQTFMDTFDVPCKPPVPIPTTEENNNRDTIPLDCRPLLRELGKACKGPRSKLFSSGLRLKPKYPLTYGKAQKYLEHFEKHIPNHPQLPEFRRLVNGCVMWDEIESIEPIGEHDCWDIEVTGDHNYIMDGIVSHNSTSIAARGVMQCNAIPNFKILYITPLYEQIRRFSHNYVRRFINESPVRTLWTGTTTQNSVLQRSFNNQSMMQFSFALTDADRIRGVSTHSVCVDEYQDMDPGLLPIIKETMSASRWDLTTLTGTPKSLDTPLEGAWQQSSQAEWFIPCRNGGCGEWNIPSREQHIVKMLGPMHPHISERYPAVICHKCRHVIDPRQGRWVHAYPDLRWEAAGYHIPQCLLPLHYADPKRWAQLLRKQQGWYNTTEAQFWNEVLGESVDVGQKLVTETDLKNCAVLPWTNNPQQPESAVIASLPSYVMRTMGVDWGGGGEKGVSFTVVSILGLLANGEIHVIWAKRLLLASDHQAEAAEVLKWFRVFDCHNIAHDFTGAGSIREAVLCQLGLPLDRLIPIRLAAAARQDLMTCHPPTIHMNRHVYSLDKTRSLLYTCQAIKTRQIKMFKYDKVDKDTPGLMSDFLSLIENKTDTRLVGDIYTITRNPLNPDDFAQSVNFGACALWHANNAWPNFAAAAAHARLTEAQMHAAGSADHGWENDYSEESHAFNEMPY